jgi:mannose/cellobiose epimerase-like protein (N-acyl-D-glucosamine 2-epimerase family)
MSPATLRFCILLLVTSSLHVFCSLAVAGGQLPVPAVWTEHVQKQLAPFWLHPDAAGQPAGNFPTFRCNSGEAFESAEPCAELADPSAWMKPWVNHQFTRMQARQTYAYGAIFHLTGDPQALALAKAGVDYLRANLIEPSGSVISVTLDGKPLYRAAQRTTQDLAYAQAGLAFYYYLTGDPAVLTDLLRIKNHIFENYWDASHKRLRWVNEASDQAKGNEIELVAQLDQINAYMLLVTPLLPEPEQSHWKRDLATLLDTLQAQFLRPDGTRFYGTLHGKDHALEASRHNDYGHTIKAWWMSWLAAEYLGNTALAEHCRTGLRATLQAAFDGNGQNGWQRLPDGSPAIWWEYAELDQAAASLALVERDAATWLQTTYPLWFTRFNATDGEVYSSSSGGLKIHLWKNGYHSLEHALVSYLTTAALTEQPARLYFSMPAEQAAQRQPYFFSGQVLSAGPPSTPIKLPSSTSYPPSITANPPPGAASIANKLPLVSEVIYQAITIRQANSADSAAARRLQPKSHAE